MSFFPTTNSFIFDAEKLKEQIIYIQYVPFVKADKKPPKNLNFLKILLWLTRGYLRLERTSFIALN